VRPFDRNPSARCLAFVAFLLLVLPAGCSAAGTTSPDATAAASLKHTTSWEDLPPDTAVDAGPYVLDYAEVAGDAFATLRFEFALPDGWFHGHVPGVVFGPTTNVAFLVVDRLLADPCDPRQGFRDPPLGPAVDDLVAALQETNGWTTDAVAQGTYFGYPGTRLTLTAPADTGACADGASRLLHVLGRLGSLPAGGGDTIDMWIVDVRGTRVVVAATHRVKTPDAELRELNAIVDSVQIPS
jgi:hypothetical protein